MIFLFALLVSDKNITFLASPDQTSPAASKGSHGLNLTCAASPIQETSENSQEIATFQTSNRK